MAPNDFLVLERPDEGLSAALHRWLERHPLPPGERLVLLSPGWEPDPDTSLPPCGLLLLPSGQEALALRFPAACVVSYGMSLKDSVTISGLTLDSYTSPGDEGKNLTILCSADGQEWIETDASTEDNIHYSFSPAECRYIRLEAGAVDADSYNNWSIHEIGLVAETEVGQ